MKNAFYIQYFLFLTLNSYEIIMYYLVQDLTEKIFFSYCDYYVRRMYHGFLSDVCSLTLIESFSLSESPKLKSKKLS